jgi:tRNA modification GTPase
MSEDTIAAVATPPGVGGIAVIRVSGPLAETVFRGLFQPKKPLVKIQSHHLYHGDIVSPRTGAVLDEALVCLMRAPHSYTGEDILEIQGHGGFLPPQEILEAVIRFGVRPAEPGEFTRRAFLNGRLDLAQAEAVADVIAAHTEKGRDAAIAQLKGDLSRRVDCLTGAITDILACLEAFIDFTEDVDEPFPRAEMAGRLQSVAQEIQDLAMTYREGRIYREGVRVVIAGRTNVGKSSLLNRLLGEKRAIVASTPGTTRDFIEESFTLHGISVWITDTAGIRQTSDAIEKEGIDLVWVRIAAADAVIVLLDGSQPLTEEDCAILQQCRTKPILPVVNKADLPEILRTEDVRRVAARDPVRISAKYDLGLDNLKEMLYRHFLIRDQGAPLPSALITNLRHKLALEKAATFLAQAGDSLTSGMSPEFTAMDIRDGLDALREIGGKTMDRDILDRIFSRFCVGK